MHMSVPRLLCVSNFIDFNSLISIIFHSLNQTLNPTLILDRTLVYTWPLNLRLLPQMSQWGDECWPSVRPSVSVSTETWLPGMSYWPITAWRRSATLVWPETSATTTATSSRGMSVSSCCSLSLASPSFYTGFTLTLFPALTGSTSCEVDVSGEHLPVCLHGAERRLVLWSLAVGDLLHGWANKRLLWWTVAIGIFLVLAADCVFTPVQVKVLTRTLPWTLTSTRWSRMASTWHGRTLPRPKCKRLSTFSRPS